MNALFLSVLPQLLEYFWCVFLVFPGCMLFCSVFIWLSVSLIQYCGLLSTDALDWTELNMKLYVWVFQNILQNNNNKIKIINCRDSLKKPLSHMPFDMSLFLITDANITGKIVHGGFLRQFKNKSYPISRFSFNKHKRNLPMGSEKWSYE